ncbi:hypothetical protein NP493_410g00035 [Ridgeia piscesae]|uniref:Thymidine kinase n=1 Tax=Ridgeia piscesae TaxID=27915 RepID=A0AAD9NVF9_RIDPI|nr:hypothetical protein NP493_410g00035 [Ridgeia piscesae]
MSADHWYLQFPDIIEFCETMANKGKTVIVAALDGTFQRQGFGDILKLVPLAENVVKLTAVCMECCGEASFTKRKGAETEVEVIGGAEKYLATCRACFKSPIRVSPTCSPKAKEREKGRRQFRHAIDFSMR